MKDRVLEKFGQNLRNLRTQKDLTQEKLAELADCHSNFIRYVETGKRSPTLQKIVKIADALECDVSVLFDGVQTSKKTRKK